jgi:putative hydrolase of the HAD superfamily
MLDSGPAPAFNGSPGTPCGPSRMIDTIAFDGDDTLWHNESVFTMTQERFRALLQGIVPGVDIDSRLFATERRNLAVFGYGIKGFTLSMIETALDVTEGRIGGADIGRILDFGKAMLAHPVELLAGAEAALRWVRERYQLMLVTKGDLFDQESKIARSGLADLFQRIEIVSEKDEATYRRILMASGIAAEAFVMVGNSVRSDILPVVALGANAVHVPYHVTWAHEVADPPPAEGAGYWRLGSLEELPNLVKRIERG